MEKCVGVHMVFQVTSVCTSVCLKRVSTAHADPAPSVVPKVEEGCGTSSLGSPWGSCTANHQCLGEHPYVLALFSAFGQ